MSIIFYIFLLPNFSSETKITYIKYVIVHLVSLILFVFFLIFSLCFSLYNFYWPISKLTHSLLCFIQFVDNSSKIISDILFSIFSILIWYFIRVFITLIKFIVVYLCFPLFHYFLKYYLVIFKTIFDSSKIWFYLFLVILTIYLFIMCSLLLLIMCVSQ